MISKSTNEKCESAMGEVEIEMLQGKDCDYKVSDYISMPYFRDSIDLTKFIVTIPKGGNFHLHYPTHLNIFSRVLMRMLGWSVNKKENDKK